MTLTAEQQRKVDGLVERLALMAMRDRRTFTERVADALLSLSVTIESQHDDNDRMLAWHDVVHFIGARATRDFTETTGSEP